MLNKTKMESLYRRYNKRRYVAPDPLQFLYQYRDLRDREIVGLIASSLAYGRVAQILKSVEIVLRVMDNSPYAFLRKTTSSKLKTLFSGFKHRFTTDRDLVNLLSGIAEAISLHGSLNECFLKGCGDSDKTTLPALKRFTSELRGSDKSCSCGMLPDPEKNSACKRLNLFLRWMVRSDAVDPGGWKGIPRNRLIVPLDTHMTQIGDFLKLTTRKSSDIITAIEITEAFKLLDPKDPVKYDFALTRFGIRKELNMNLLFQELNNA